MDIVGRKFGMLTVVSRIDGTRKHRCICDCGKEKIIDCSNLVSGRQISCGCYNMKRRHERHKDLSSTTLNGVYLISLEETEIDKNNRKHIRYKCKCQFCGKEFVARYENIKTGNTKGCGCTRHQYTSLNDLTNMNFEFCHVDSLAEKHIQQSGGQRTMYNCTCCCGNKYKDWAYTILHGRSNCGCKRIRSKGENAISEYLSQTNTSFVSQYWFSDLRGNKNRPLYFDFALLNDKNEIICLIEYQGKQHYEECKKSIKDFGKRQREVTDKLKKKYCEDNNIKLFEISYKENITESVNKILNCLS